MAEPSVSLSALRLRDVVMLGVYLATLAIGAKVADVRLDQLESRMDRSEERAAARFDRLESRLDALLDLP